MKKLLLPFFALVFLISCEKERDTEILLEQENIEDINITTRSSNKRDVCHNGNIININVNAIPAHQAHGDAVDMDGDGYFDIDNPCSETDCDDTDATINPGVTDICGNGIDDDCDGIIDNTGVTEICGNGIDDDCNGIIDNIGGTHAFCATNDPCVVGQWDDNSCSCKNVNICNP